MHEHADDGSLDWAGLEILSNDECIQLLREAPVGRLGFVDAGEPVILPINFLWHDGRILFRTASGSKLSVAMMQRSVCLEIDGWDAREHTGYSVLVKGTADEVIDEETIAAYASLPVRPWSRPDLRTHWVCIHPGDITGRALRAHGD